jgi:6-phosphogluconolactonase
MPIWKDQSGQVRNCKLRRGVLLSAAVLVLALVAFSPGCGSPKIRFGYVATGQGIFAFRVDAGTGASSVVFGSPFVAFTNANFAAAPSSAVVHPSNGLVYAAQQDINNISRFRIDSHTGSLTEVMPRTPLTNSSGGIGLSPAAMIMDSDGKYLFVANQVSNDIWVFSIGSSGTLTFVSSVSLAGPPSSLTLSASGNFLYVPVPIFSAIYVFSVNAGALTQVGNPFAVSGGVGNLGVDGKGNFLFVPNPSTDTVTVLRVQSDGTLALSAGAFATSTTPVAAATVTNTTGEFLYVANSGSNNLSQFQVDTTTGELTTLTNASTVGTGTQPSQIVVDPDGTFIFAVNQQSNTISEFLQNTNGTLYTTGNSLSVTVLPRSFSITK